MIPPWIGRGAEAIAALGGVATVYVGLGFPIPATVAQLDAKIAGVNDSISALNTTVLKGQRQTISLARNSLWLERANLTRLLTVQTDPVLKLSIDRRINEIDAALNDLNSDDEDLRKKISAAK